MTRSSERNVHKQSRDKSTLLRIVCCGYYICYRNYYFSIFNVYPHMPTPTLFDLTKTFTKLIRAALYRRRDLHWSSVTDTDQM